MLTRALVVAVILVSVCLAGLIVYGVARPALSEQEVICVVYDYLVAKAEQLPAPCSLEGWRGPCWWEVGVIQAAFVLAVTSATAEVVEEGDWGESVDVTFGLSELVLTEPFSSPFTVPTFSKALKKLAKYEGNGVWSVCIYGKWRVDERTSEVTPQNEQAEALLQEISLATYHHRTYGYCISYPPSWAVSELGDGYVGIVCPEPQTDVLIGRPNRLLTGQTLEQYCSGFASFLAERKQGFELIGLEVLEDGDYRMDFKWEVGGTRIWSIVYFVVEDGWAYTISASAPAAELAWYDHTFSYVYESFCFSGVE